MTGFEWRRALTGADPGWWGRPGERRTVLIVVGSPVPGQPALDVARFAGADPRLRVLFAAAPGPSAAAVEMMLKDAGTAPLRWSGLADGDVGLVVTAHRIPARSPGAPLIALPGTIPAAVAHRPAPAVFTYAHHLDRPPDAEEGRAVVVGDSDHDRLVASLPLRDFYRRALGVGGRRGLVVVALPADGGAGACTCRRPADVVRRLLAELPRDRYDVLGVPEPGGDPSPGGPGLAVHLRNGLGLLPPEADWRAALVAADWIIGPPGRVTRYGTLTGVPVLITGPQPGDALRLLAVRLAAHRPVLPQLTEAAARWRPERVRPVAGRITSEPGRFDRNMRSLMYGLLRLPQPATIPVADPVSPPFRIGCRDGEPLGHVPQGG
ncbi:hypothetical protein E1281_16725 [Actinomadura sp. KC345]|uniref:hypothetical protein n=1 Tax=Actinomadura sp. KC345 TaxID=2530371 RepID=UPI00104E97D6|nr:hypothetical protein [Actinomadura sp. KC345]TDC54076.1 hypothetical protein E1281_16725 [Actinomadura sp. KC345]